MNPTTSAAELRVPGIGRIAIIAAAAGLVRVEFLADTSPPIRPSGTGEAARMRDRALRELAAYPGGGALDCPVVLDGLPPFIRRALIALRRVPRGRTIGYGDLAGRAGSPGAARAAGSACARNPIPLWIPCHRVVASTGLGGFSGGLDIKCALLRLESCPASSL